MTRRYFGTDGIRGPARGPLLSDEFVARLGRALGDQLREIHGDRPIQAAIGRDPRTSGARIVEALVRGLGVQGIHVHDLGIVPTPGVAMAVRDLHADLGVAVTASHNPATDNGIKLFDGTGFKWPDAAEEALERRIDALVGPPIPPLVPTYPHEGASWYRQALRSQLHEGSLSGWTIAVDAAHGATAGTTPTVLSELGARVVGRGLGIDGTRINDACGSEHPEGLAALVLEHGARLGIAHDGDGDRVVLVDETGAIVDGDELLAILALAANREGRLAHRTLVATVMSNLGLDDTLGAAGIRVVRVGVGDRYVVEEMRRGGFSLGGENSGHVIIGEASTTGDGLLAALRVLGEMQRTGRPLSELRRVLELYPQAKRNLPVRERVPLERIPALGAEIATLERGLGRGRILVRYSGTEPKIRLLVEGRDAALVKATLENLATAVTRHLG